MTFEGWFVAVCEGGSDSDGTAWVTSEECFVAVCRALCTPPSVVISIAMGRCVVQLLLIDMLQDMMQSVMMFPDNRSQQYAR